MNGKRLSEKKCNKQFSFVSTLAYLTTPNNVLCHVKNYKNNNSENEQKKLVKLQQRLQVVVGRMKCLLAYNFIQTIDNDILFC